MMPIETLLRPFGGGAIEINGKNILFLNAVYSPSLSVFDSCNITLQQYFKPYENSLNDAGYTVISPMPSDDIDYNVVCVLVPKSMIEARYMIAKGISSLKAGGELVCAASNKAGGSRLRKTMQDFGMQDLHEESKNKARVVWGSVQNYNNDSVKEAIENGEEQDVMNGDFVSQPGVFGWDRVDNGSEILTRFLPDDLRGSVADFGCGYGYLSKFLLSKYPKIKKLYCIDADYRSVELCKKNLSSFNTDRSFMWDDLTLNRGSITNLNFIVMNPPFHEGKKTDISIGHKFIDTACQSLSKGGRLFMVANSHLAYENILDAKFSEVSKIHESQGFKVITARK